MRTPTDNGFRKTRFTESDGSGYSAIFAAEPQGPDFASDTYATPGVRYEYTVVGDDDLTLRSMQADGGSRGGVIGPRRDHVVFWLAKGRLEMHFADRTQVVTPGRPSIASASEAYRFESEDTAYHGIHIADRFLRQTARELGLRLPDGPLLFDQQDEAVARYEPLRRLLREVRCTLLDDRVVGPMRTALNRRLATVVLDTFPVRDRGDDVPVANRLRDAIRFIEANAAARPAVPDIARACGLSERGLQEVFARTLETTPARFLRDHRLDQVRGELLLADARTTVAEVSGRWGFTNPGRFASGYRERFGEDPGATLRAHTHAGGRRGRYSWRLRAAMSFVEQHHAESLTLTRIAEAAGVRPRRLQQLFRSEHGCSPMQFLRQARDRAERTRADGIGEVR
jgi:AraC-like DNA-binding protein